MAQLQELLRLAHTPNPQMQSATQQLSSLELQPGFGAALLALLQSCGEALLAQAAAIYLKNFLQRRWQSLEDREMLRDSLVPVALAAEKPVRKQLCAAVEELALQDLDRWPQLLPQLVSAHSASRSNAQGALELAHAALRQLRAEGRHVEMSRQARCFAEVLGPMHLELWRLACDRVVSDIPDRESIELLLAATQVLFDLSRLVMVDQVQENLQTYMQGILALLQRLAPNAASSELLQELCGLLAMWLSRYGEVLEAFVGRSVEAVWSLLIKLDESTEHDALVISAIAVLSSVSCQEWQASPFKDPTVLAAICERVVLPNLKLRASDLELFQDDLQEYIARDVEGNDIQTRRWAAIDLVRSLRRRHDKETCEFVVTCIQRVLRETVADPRSAAICKHACIHLVISMAGSTGGQSIQSPGGLATEFFKEQLGPELLAVQAPPQGTSVEAVLFKAACLKFLTVLRNILPAELMLGVLPVLPLLLQAEHPLLHSYAAICANVLTTVQERVHEPGALPLWRPRYRREQLGPMLLQMIPTMLQILVEGRSIPKNTHLIRALLAWLNFLGPTVPPELVVKILQSLTQLVRALPSSGSGHAEFVHLLFGSLALALKAHSTAGSTAVVFPMVEQLWVSQVEDLLPYCYQIMGLMLDLGHSPVPLYGELLPKILAPDLWQAPGKVPGLVRLLRAFFAKVDFFRSVLQPAMGEIFARFQQALGNRQSASAAVGLLCAAFRFLPFELYCNHFQAALEACLTRLEGIKAPELEKDLVVALSIFVHVYGDPTVLCVALNQLKEGLFERFLMEVWLPGTYRIQLLQRRKICIFGLIRVMHLPMPPKVLEACCQALLRLLRLRQAGHPVLIFEELFNNRPLFLCKRSEGINPGDEFQVAYNHLDQAELKEDVWDVLPEIQDVPTAKVAVKQALAQLGEVLSKVEGMTRALEEILR
ncbi:Exportin-2 (Exp2) (Cellular apoptosis susceptibility protein) (Chromosome segregation 1-like protein) (Importin-alpha re-exporter) [Durusdinium trenchii]|uniref:Exportin-2 (Exp2) (Cellular apoptosis susceptibility protein) (Chromosome segregation 1-like protein) (Importin-alpha re-exporter) n=1 Tax=Durusdinium trenchii TaxID=1381693 RepID=A0ABP0SQY3_9DINO